MAAADNTPDFDSMSPEEMNRWLESLAKRQGANAEELTTSADMDIAEIDPETAVIDEPGYVPYGEERPVRPQATAEPPRPVMQPQAEPEPEPTWSAPPTAPEPPVSEPADALDGDALAWLESLAAGQGDALFNLDLSALTNELEQPTPERADAPTDPMAWLRSLANEDDTAQAEEPPTAQTPAPAVADPFEGGVDPMAWLENLARRQGARDEELTTQTEIEIPIPENPVIDEPGYTPFSFDAPVETRHAEPEPALDLEDPSSWLGSLADAQGFDEGQILTTTEAEDAATLSFEIADIEQAIAKGTVTPEQMQVYLEHETDVYVESLEDEAMPDEEAPPVPADLPDWLLEQVGPPPSSDESEHLRHLPPLTDVIAEPPPAADMPDWLNEDLPVEGELDFDSIFANVNDELFVAPDGGDFSGLTLDVDPDDPWVEAFDAEQNGQGDDLETPPDWYTRNLNDPQRLAAVQAYESDDSGLMPATLPEETDLPAGEMMALPEGFSRQPTAPAVDDVPDWLAELETELPGADIPDWLSEPMDEVQAEQEPAPAPPVVQPPRPVAPPSVPSSEALAAAREQARTGDLNVALDTYESLVRATHDLESVVADLQSLVRQHRSNPAVYRVLGDGLMRQGNLQSALDTYREALNLL